MGHFFQKVAVACVMASFSLSVVAQENPKAKIGKSNIDYSKAIQIVITDTMLSDLKKSIILRRELLVKLADPNCNYQSGGVCPIEIPVLLLPDPADPAKFYCVAVFPELVVLPGSTLSNPPEKTIVWSLKPPASPPPGATFTFWNEKDHGIILLSNGSNQMHNGTLGDGTMPLDPTKYMFKHKNNVSKAQAVYLPIIVRTDTTVTPPSKKVSVCGTPDPIIAND